MPLGPDLPTTPLGLPGLPGADVGCSYSEVAFLGPENQLVNNYCLTSLPFSVVLRRDLLLSTLDLESVLADLENLLGHRSGCYRG